MNDLTKFYDFDIIQIKLIQIKLIEYVYCYQTRRSTLDKVTIKQVNLFVHLFISLSLSNIAYDLS
jgi:hypothetical protein